MSFSDPAENRVYLDHNATTPLAEGLAPLIHSYLGYWGNPSSIHWAGRQPKRILREARETLAQLLHVHPLELVYTSGGTEANNQALRGLYFHTQTERPDRRRVIVSAVEHPSVLKTAEALQAQGADLKVIPVSRQGELDMAALEDFLSVPTALVSVMYANNETGHIFPVKKVAKLARAAGAKVHSDCVQTLGKVPLNLDQLEVDMASFSAHKFYSLKGTGVLYCRRGVNWLPQMTGGGQERGRRGGTENVLGIMAMGWMAEQLVTGEAHFKHLQELRDYFEEQVRQKIDGIEVTGPGNKRIPNTSHMIIEGVDGETLLMNLDMLGFAVSTGAACSSGSPEPSPALMAMGFRRQEAQCSLRVSLGWQNSKDEIDDFLSALESVVLRIRNLQKT